MDINVEKITSLLVDARSYVDDGETRCAVRSLNKLAAVFGLDLDKLVAEENERYEAFVKSLTK